MNAFTAFHAIALVSIDEIGAGVGPFARVGRALVNVDLAFASGVTGFAVTRIAVDQVVAASSVLARTTGAFVQLFLAGFATISGFASTEIVSD